MEENLKTKMKKMFVSLLFIFITQSVLADMVCDISVSDYFAIYEPNSYTCNYGQYLPANTNGCQNCLYGHICSGGTYTFNETLDQGSVVGVYHCNTGYFLPANSDTCYMCPNDFTCPGGTFEFNPDIFQGLEITSVPNNTLNNICAVNFPGDLFAIYEPNVHNCSAGYYLPANVDACTICPANNKCVGGTYTFNETTTQGIEQCPAGTFAPVGSAVCYDHILHVGNENIYLRSTKRTTPSLNVAYGENIYYANATTVPTPITAGSQHYLKVMYNDTEYYICDDTTYNE